MPLTGITIGRNIILVFIFLLCAAIRCGKGPELPTDNYSVFVHNLTPNTLFFNYKHTGQYSRNEEQVIAAYDSIKVGTASFNNTDNQLDPVKQFFIYDYFYAKIYRNDSLKVTWNGPAEDLTDSIHSFFNYNSWEVEPTPDVADQTGTLNFYIEEEDLK